MNKSYALFPPLYYFYLPAGFTGFTLLHVIFLHSALIAEVVRGARTAASSHLALIPHSLSRIDEVPSVKSLTSIWASNGETWLVTRESALGEGSAASLQAVKA